MGEPLLEKPIPRTLKLHEDSNPVGKFTVRAEPFGYVLICGNRVIPVKHGARPLLDALDGSLSLSEVGRDFGQRGLDLVGSLYEKGFLELKNM